MILKKNNILTENNYKKFLNMSSKEFSWKRRLIGQSIILSIPNTQPSSYPPNHHFHTMSTKVKKQRVFANRQTSWSSKDGRAFRSAYIRLGKQGLCDAVGGCEYTRVKEKWKAYKGPMDLDTFIKIHANVCGCVASPTSIEAPTET